MPEILHRRVGRNGKDNPNRLEVDDDFTPEQIEKIKKINAQKRPWNIFKATLGRLLPTASPNT